MKPKLLPEQNELKKYLKYNNETGELFWIKKPSKTSRINVNKRVGNLKTTGYRRLAFRGVTYAEHRIIYKLVHGQFDESNQIDHINGVKNDNRITNLRQVSSSLNSRNTIYLKLNKNGVSGIHFVEEDGRYEVRLARVYIGSSKSLEEAKHMRNVAAKQMGFTDRHGKID